MPSASSNKPFSIKYSLLVVCVCFFFAYVMIYTSTHSVDVVLSIDMYACAMWMLMGVFAAGEKDVASEREIEMRVRKR